MLNLVVLLALAIFALWSEEVYAADKPNIVLIIADDVGYGDINSFYAPTLNRTTNIDALAAEGTKLTSFYAAPICTPSRAAMLTGRYQARDGWGWALSPVSTDGIDRLTFVERLRRKGYRTGLFGKWHLGLEPEFSPNLHGFNRFFGVPHGNNAVPLRYTSNSTVLDESPTQADLTPRFTEEAIEFINNNKDRPFYAELAYTAAHTPFGNETYRQVIQKMDTNIGLVLDALDDAGIADDTLVIFTTDNGPALYAGPNHGSTGPLSLAAGAPDFGGKRSVYEGGIRVPFIARWPGHVPHRTVSAPAMNIDFYPTFMALAGLSIANPSQFDGKDISPVLLGTGERPGADEFLFYSMNKLRAFRSGDWKVHFDAAGRAGQLYNLATDLGEQNNLARSQPAKLQSMSARAKQLDAGLIRESPPKI